MGFGAAVSSGFRNTFRWNGRASRPAFWWFFLLFFLLGGGASLLENEILGSETTFLTTGLIVVFFLPLLSVIIRRFHDTNRSGFWVLIVLVPLVGYLVLLLMMLAGSAQGSNQWGPNPAGQVSFAVEDEPIPDRV